jgi:RNA polymerase sigma-70 factor (ECF subfamily)
VALLDQKNGKLLPRAGVVEPGPGKLAARPAFPEIFQQHAQFIWRALMNLGVQRYDAQDVCQEVMIIAHRRLPTFEGRSIRAWLYGICVRKASEYRRSARVRREVPSDSLDELAFDGTQDEVLARNRRLRRTLAALDELDEARRAAFVLYEVEELTLAEVSEALEVPLQTVYSRIKSARAALRLTLAVAAEGDERGVLETG